MTSHGPLRDERGNYFDMRIIAVIFFKKILVCFFNANFISRYSGLAIPLLHVRIILAGSQWFRPVMSSPPTSSTPYS